MNIVYLNYYYDKDIETPEELLKRYWSSTEWCKAIAKAGAARVSLVQRFHTEAHIEQDGVDWFFVSDGFPHKLPPFVIPKKVHQKISALQPDVVHHNGWPYPLKFLRTQLQKNAVILWQHHGGGMPQWYSKRFYKKGFQSVDGFLFTSEEIAKPWIIKGIIDYFKPIYEIIESSSTLTPKDKTRFRKELELRGKEIFLWVGRLDENKDPLTVLEGFRKAILSLQDPHLYMVYHEQHLLEKIRKYCHVNQIDKRIHLIGKLDRDTLQNYYCASDYFILGSHTEGSGYALLEALSCGLVPIVPDIPSFRKILAKGEIGFLWQVGNSDSLVTTIKFAATHHTNQNEVRLFFEKYLSFDQLGKNALEVYQTISTTKKSYKKKVAVVVPGGIDKPDSGFTLAPLFNLLKKLSYHYDIHIYSLVRLFEDDEKFFCGNAKVKFLHARHNDNFLKKLLLLLYHIRKGIKLYNYDILHGLWGTPTGFSVVIMGKIYHIPSIVHLLGAETVSIPTIKYGNMRSFLQRLIIHWTCNLASKLIVLTEYQKNQLHSIGIKRKEVLQIPIGADEIFFNNNLKRTLHFPLKLLAVGAINKVKNQLLLLQVFKKILNELTAELDVVGPDYMNGHLQRWAADLELNGKIRFHGMVNHQEMKKFYQDADIMLHTSLHEAQGVVIAEAAAAGVAICGTSVGLISDFSPDKAIAIDSYDADIIAAEVVQLAKDTERLTSLRTSAFQWAKEHDLDWTVSQISQVYNTLSSQKE